MKKTRLQKAGNQPKRDFKPTQKRLRQIRRNFTKILAISLKCVLLIKKRSKVIFKAAKWLHLSPTPTITWRDKTSCYGEESRQYAQQQGLHISRGVLEVLSNIAFETNYTSRLCTVVTAVRKPRTLPYAPPRFHDQNPKPVHSALLIQSSQPSPKPSDSYFFIFFVQTGQIQVPTGSLFKPTQLQ